MTEPTPGRAEQALRDALSRHADDLPSRRLETVRRRRLPVVAAAAAVALIAGLAWVVLPGLQGGGRPPVPSAGSSDPRTGQGDRRIVGFLDVSIEVPATWLNADAPTDQWCIAGRDGAEPVRADFPTGPYVARDSSMAAQTLVACQIDRDVPSAFPPVPPRFWAPHLSLVPGDTPDLAEGVESFRGWTLTTRLVGSVAVRLLTDEATTPLVEPILATAAVRQTDASGCDTTSPVQAAEFVRPPAFDVSGVAGDEVRSVAVCQYRRGGLESAGLLASRVLEGSAASEVVDAVVAAPVGGGPDRPTQCAADLFGDEAIVLRLQGADGPFGDLYVYYDWCFGNGIDDGTTRRAITRDNCEPLWGDPVLQYGGSSNTFRLCHPNGTAG